MQAAHGPHSKKEEKNRKQETNTDIKHLYVHTEPR